MKLNSRQIQTIRMLSQATSGLALSTVAKTHGISLRTAYYDLNAINEFCAEHDLGQVHVTGRRLVGEVDWVRTHRLLTQGKRLSFSASERRAMMVMHIALSGERITIGHLIDTFEVSRNTIIADIRGIKDRLQDFGIQLQSSQKTGYQVVGKEAFIRKVLWNELQRFESSECLTALRGFLQYSLVKKTGEDIDFFELCRCLIKQYESDLGIRCFLEGNGRESTMIQISWLRSLDGHFIDMDHEEQAALMDTLSYRSILRSANKLRESGIHLPSEELLYLTSLLLGVKTADFIGQREEDEYVSDLAERLATNFEHVSCLNYVDKRIVCDQITHHIRPMYYRMKYGLQANNPLTSDIKKMYPLTYEFARRATLLTGLDQLDDNEIAYLTIYLTAGLDSKMFEDGDTSSTKVLVVGAANMSTITLVRQRITDACGMKFDYSFMDIAKLRRWMIDRYALVIALNPLPRQLRGENVVEVSPMLSDENLASIFEVLKKNLIVSRFNGMIEEIIAILKENLPERDHAALESDKLYFELFRYFNERDVGGAASANCQPAEPEFSARIVGVSEQETWQQVVLAGCTAICEETGSRLLVDRMRNLVTGRKFQWYRMADDAVVVHCPMQGDACGGVHAQIVVSSGSGIVFPDRKRAKVVFCLTTVDRYSHWGTLYSIYTTYSDPARLADSLAAWRAVSRPVEHIEGRGEPGEQKSQA